MRETETVVSPYELLLTREDGRIVEVTVRAVGTGELDLTQLQQAWRALTDKLRHDELRQRNRRRFLASRDDADHDVLARLTAAWQAAGGQLTDEYLATLAIAYEEVSKLPGRGVLDDLAVAIGRPMATVKSHVARAREEGFLTPTSKGRSGGQATARARELVSSQLGIE
ncbi:hypothetical protein [Pseudonocardia sp. NPDC049635]|uniref:hypothetical protein n=1 Tax=Pseudonocardia sp. NPDC049635 TaxID=3155506 RepID=UPI0033F54541